MPLGKGLAFSALGAMVGAIVWVILIRMTGWSLWIFAPIVGGAAGFGMMYGTKMRGGLLAGAAAAAFTVVAIFGARLFVISSEVRKVVAVDSEHAIGMIAEEVANEWIEKDIETYDEEEGDFRPEVYATARERWAAMSPSEQTEYLAAFQPESEAAAAIVTPIALVFDFGLIGTFIAAISAASAFKLGSLTLERALVQEGHAAGATNAAGMAVKLRAGETVPDAPVASGGSFWTRPLPPVDDGLGAKPAQPQGNVSEPLPRSEAA